MQIHRNSWKIHIIRNSEFIYSRAMSHVCVQCSLSCCCCYGHSVFSENWCFIQIEDIIRFKICIENATSRSEGDFFPLIRFHIPLFSWSIELNPINGTICMIRTRNFPIDFQWNVLNRKIFCTKAIKLDH